ncbi:MAG: hypothetical protein NT133_09990 [Alphaproteobacteria bacterium]|nr:hypothetical protein [Alphaproteobacteria bacterium]
MIHPSHIPNLPAGTPEVIRRFVMALGGVLEAIGRAFNPNPKPPVPGLVIWAYLIRVRARFLRLMPLLLAGAPPKVWPRRASRERGERKTPRLRLPGRKAWLGSEIGWWGRGFGLQIEYLFNDPETAALIAGSPQAQRLLRPLCRMLGLTVPAIPPLPARPRKPRPKPAKPKRLTRREREAILWYPNSEGKPMKLLPRRLPRD